MRLLDYSRPYAEIHGLPGAAYEQDGVRFKGNGTEAISGDLQPFVEEIKIDDKYEINPPSVSCIEAESLPVETGKSLDDMHWRHLKALVESFGGEWTTRQDAIAFMNGKQ